MPDPPSQPPPSADAVPAVPRRRTRRGLAQGGVALLVLVALAGAWWWTAGRSAPPRYLTAAVTRGDVTRAVTATGTVNPVLTIIVGTYVSGVIQQISCDYNTKVKQGQVCAKIDPRPYQAVVDQDKANLDVARAQLGKDQAALVYAQVNDQRDQKLVLRNYVSKDVADNARSVYEQAKAQITYDTGETGVIERQLSVENV